MTTETKPVIFLAFANDHENPSRFLRNLSEESRQLLIALHSAQEHGLCEVVIREGCTANDIFEVFQDQNYRDRVAVFHFAGHANGYELLLETARGKAAPGNAAGLASFLGNQRGLQIVFLNGCSTQQQSHGLLDAKVQMVISTSRAIDDAVATQFSHLFYKSIAGGASIRIAFNEAQAAIHTVRGGNKRLLYIDEAESEHTVLLADRWPWELSVRKGAEAADQWNLPDAVDDPLFGLPDLPERELPFSPYRHLNWFTRDDAEVFFGRGHQIREMYTAITDENSIVFLYGQSGVGKSSLLDAGLIPRLESEYEVSYLRRDYQQGLTGTLQLAFLPEAAEVPIEQAWIEKEKAIDRPLVVILDQIEELFTQPCVAMSPEEELRQFLTLLDKIFLDTPQAPQGTLVLGFRKEWLDDFERRMLNAQLTYTKVPIYPLDRRGIMQVVIGPTRSDRLAKKYGLQVDGVLPEVIANDMLADKGSAIAPTLQILLTKLWSKTSGDQHSPKFTETLYQQLKKEGILLRDFMRQQVRAFHQKFPEAVDSGLLLDLMSQHTTPLGTASQSTTEELERMYHHIGPQLNLIRNECQNLHLLTIPDLGSSRANKTTRLAHDTLAPIIREKYEASDKPGQRARRILDNRSVDWENDQTGIPLDEADLSIVEGGLEGTHSLRVSEARLLMASRAQRTTNQRNRRRLKITGIVATAVMTLLGIFGWWNYKTAAELGIDLSDKVISLNTSQRKLGKSNRELMIQRDIAIKERRDALRSSASSDWAVAVTSRDVNDDKVKASHLMMSAANKYAQINQPQSAGNMLTAIQHTVSAAFPYGAPVSQAIINAEDSLIIAWGESNPAQLWTPEEQQVQALNEQPHIAGAEFSKKSPQQFLTWSRDGTTILWKLEEGLPCVQKKFVHQGAVLSATFNKEETKILTCSEDGTARLWDLTNDSKKSDLLQQGGTYLGAQFDEHGTRVLTWSKEGPTKVWDAANGMLISSFPHSGGLYTGQLSLPVLSHDGKKVVTTNGEGSASIWEISSTETALTPIMSLESDEIPFKAGFTKDDQRLLTWGGYGPVRVWDIKSNTIIAENDDGAGTQLGAIFTNDETAVLSWASSNAILWNSSTGQAFGNLSHKQSVSSASLSQGATIKGYNYSPQILTSEQNGAVGLWTNYGQRIRTLPHSPGRSGCLFTNSESRVLTWDSDGVVRLWNIAENRTFHHHYDQQPSIAAQQFKKKESGCDSAGHQLLTWSKRSNVVNLWDTESGLLEGALVHSKPVNGAKFLGLHEAFSWSDDGAFFWDTSIRKVKHTFQHDHLLLGASIFPGEKIWTWDTEGFARLWDLQTGSILRHLSHLGAFAHIEMDPVGKSIATWNDKEFFVRSLSSPALFKYDRSNSLISAKYTNDGRKLLCCWEGFGDSVTLTNTQNGRQFEPFQIRQSVIGSNIDYSNLIQMNVDCTRLYAGGYQNSAACWDIALEGEWGIPSQKIANPIQKYSNVKDVHGMQLSQDETRLLVWSLDGTIKILDVESGRVLRTLRHETDLMKAQFIQNDSLVLAWSTDSTARLWDLTRNEPLHSFTPNPAYGILDAHLSPDQSKLFTWDQSDVATMWTIHPLGSADEELVEKAKLKLEVQTAMTFEEGAYRVLELDEWKERRDKLGQSSNEGNNVLQ